MNSDVAIIRSHMQSHALASIVLNPKAFVFVLIIAVSLWTGTVFSQTAPLGVEEEIEGDLEILHEDNDQGGRYHYFLNAAGRRLTLQFAEVAPTHLSTGARIRARGARANGVLALKSGGSDSVQVVSSALAKTLGEQRTLVILVNFRNDSSQPYTVDFANNVIFGTTSNFFLENSYRQTYLSGVVMGWYTIDMDSPTNSATCNYSLISSLADQAASNAGVVLSNYSRKIYAFPQTGCGWWGLSSLGGDPSRAWVNGSLEVRVVAHELGHGFGLYHSHALDCGSTTLGTTCTSVEYGDVVDTMGGPIGFSPAAHYNAFQKEQLGWLNAGISPPVTTVGSGGTFTLGTYESLDAGAKALKILKSIDPITGQRTWYYVESRQAIGFDEFLDDWNIVTNVPNGVLVRMGTEGNGDSSYLLDLTPETESRWDSALAAGQSFHDSGSGVTMTTQWVSGTGAAVIVSFGAAVGVATNKTSYTRNESVSITASVHSGSAPVANTTVNFKIKKSNGSLVTGTVTTGSNGAAVYNLRLTKKDPVGTYQADATALSTTATRYFVVR